MPSSDEIVVVYENEIDVIKSYEGPAGPPNSLSIGTVNTGASAAATITGSSPSQVLNLTLPQGPVTDLTAGSVTTGAAGSSASASITGTAPNKVLNLTIPRGNTGATGPAGPANTLDVSGVTTGAAGTNASVTISGTSPNQSLAFTIPRGATGLTGNTGPAGPANTLSIGTVSGGATASATITGTSPSQTLNLVLPKGDTGAAGPANTLSIGTVTTGAAAATITGTSPSQTLNLTVPNGPPGGATDNVMAKNSATNYDFKWVDPNVAINSAVSAHNTNAAAHSNLQRSASLNSDVSNLGYFKGTYVYRNSGDTSTVITITGNGNTMYSAALGNLNIFLPANKTLYLDAYFYCVNAYPDGPVQLYTSLQWSGDGGGSWNGFTLTGWTAPNPNYAEYTMFVAPGSVGAYGADRNIIFRCYIKLKGPSASSVGRVDNVQLKGFYV